MTTHQDFVRVIERFCEHCGLGDPTRILQGGAVAVDGIAFSLIYSEQVDPDLLFLYADYGEVPPGREAEVYRALLEMNLHVYTGRGPVLTLSADSGHVVRAEHCPLVDLKPQALYTAMVKIAGDAKAWRDDPSFKKTASASQPKAVRGAVTSSALRSLPPHLHRP
jgi:hypothetical protein